MEIFLCFEYDINLQVNFRIQQNLTKEIIGIRCPPGDYGN